MNTTIPGIHHVTAITADAQSQLEQSLPPLKLPEWSAKTRIGKQIQ
jgi:hypothetical protein